MRLSIPLSLAFFILIGEPKDTKIQFGHIGSGKSSGDEEKLFIHFIPVETAGDFRSIFKNRFMN